MTALKSWLRAWSIKSHLVIGVTLVHAALMTIFIFDTYSRQSEQIKNSLRNEASNFITTLSFASKHWVLAKDLEGLAEIISSQEQLNHLDQVFILDTKGKVLAHSNPQIVGNYVADQKSIDLLHQSHKKSFILYEDHHVLDMVSPVIFNDVTYGWVRARFSTQHISASLNNLLWNGILYTVIAIATGWLMAYLLSRVLTQQLTSLTEITQNFKNGHRNLKATSFNTKEVALLSHVFNEMIETIKNEELALKNSEERLKKSEERFSLAMEGSNEGLWDWDLVSNEVYFSPRWKTILGYSDEEIPNNFNEWKKRIHPEDVDTVIQELNHYLNSNSSMSFENTHRLQHKDGHYVFILDKGFCLRDTHNVPFRMIGTHTDITSQITTQQEKENLQLRFVETAKMAALGEMSGGIAHEINNPLAIIIGKTELLLKFIDKFDEKKDLFIKDLDVIKRTALRISKIIKGLRSFSRNAENDPMINAQLKTIIEETLDLCRQKFTNSGIEIRAEIDDVTINCRPVEISQVFMNLFSNSFDAISPFEDKWISIKTKMDDKSIKVYFTDSGKGIPSTLADKMFQPFYTTKEAGKGTGLGLSISATIIKNHGGSLSYDKSAVNTSFCLELPYAQKSELKQAS